MQNRTRGQVIKALADLGKIALSILFTTVIGAILTIPVTIVALIADPAKITAMPIKVDMFSGFGIAVMICSYIGFTAATIILYALFERKRGWAFGWKQRDQARWLAIGIGTGTVLMVAAWVLIRAAGGLQVTSIGFGRAWTPIIGLLMFVFVAFGEEWFSRGYVQGLVRRDFGPAAAVCVSSLLFASLHGFNEGVWQTPIPIANLFLAGMLLGLSKERSGGLWMPMGLHLAWNYMQGIVLGFPVSGTSVDSWIHMRPQGFAFVSGGTFGAEGSLLATGILLVAVIVLARMKNAATAPRLTHADLPRHPT